MEDFNLIIKGFNAGYLLEKYDPELSKKIFKGLEGKDIPYVQGYVAGVKEYTLERTLERFRSKSKDKDKDFDIEF